MDAARTLEGQTMRDDDDTLDMPAKHGEPGHICDGDKHDVPANAEFAGPHVTMVIRACGSPTNEVRVRCACGYLSKLFPTRQHALVNSWLHGRAMAKQKAPRGGG